MISVGIRSHIRCLLEFHYPKLKETKQNKIAAYSKENEFVTVRLKHWF